MAGLQDYRNATVGEAPAAAPSPALERYRNARVTPPPPSDDERRKDATQATDAMLTYTAPSSGSLSGWLARAGRAASFGLSDPISAAVLKYAPEWAGGDKRLENISYGDVVSAISKGYDEDRSLTADLAGALAPGSLVASGLRRGAAWAATRSGIVDGALTWAARSGPLNRIAGAAAAGAGGGAVEEALRSSIGETVDAMGGEGFDGSKVATDVIGGALVGALAAPALQEGLRGGASVLRWMKAMGGASDTQTAQAAERLLRSVAEEGEDLGAAADRLSDKVVRFRQTNGYMPSLAQVLPPEKVRDAAAVIGSFNGLDIPARQYAEDGVQRALRAYDNAIASGRPLASTEQVQADMEDLFTSVMTRHGRVPVRVAPEALDSLASNRGWLQTRANNGNDGAQRMLDVIDAKANITAAQEKLRQLRSADSVASARVFAADVDNEIEKLLAAQVDEAEDVSRLQALQVLRNQIRTGIRAMVDNSGKRRADFNLTRFEPSLRAMENTLEDYAANGLRVRLSDANHMRAIASRAAYGDADFDKRDTARAIRDLIAPIGTREVPEYGDVVRRWGNEMTRAEAQPTGEAAARGTLDIGDLQTRVQRHRLPDKPRVTGDRAASLEQGVREGALRTLQTESAGAPEEAVRGARRVAESQRVQQGLGIAAPADAGRIVASAKHVKDSYDSLKALAQPISPTRMQEEAAEAKEFLSGAVFGRLGGAARAGILTRVWMHLGIPRGTAAKIVDMLGDPNKVDQALAYVQSKGIRLGALTGALTAALGNSGGE